MSAPSSREPSTAAERRARTFARRSRAAVEGRHLPTLEELLEGMPFFIGRLDDDAREFGERLLVRLSRRKSVDPDLVAVKECLVTLTMHPSLSEFRAAAGKCREIRRLSTVAMAECALRCDLYAACHGCPVSALRVAAEAVALAERSDDAGVSWRLTARALGWLRNEDIYSSVGTNRGDVVAEIGERLLQKVGRASEHGNRGDAPGMGEGGGGTQAAGRRWFEPPKPGGGSTPVGDLKAIVFGEAIGNPNTAEGRRVVQAFGDIVGNPLPLVAMPNLVSVRHTLVAEFPHAEEIIRPMLEEVALRPHVALRPIVLVGQPGTGKTRFARRLLEVLGVPAQIYPCGGVADASLAGTSRRWSTGEPCLPVAMIRHSGCASPGIILDELEKAGTSRRNGNVLDALLGLLEHQSASRWHDPYLEAAVDLSHVVWVGTANSLEGLPSPLRDRCRILEYPAPDHRHLPILTTQLLVELIRERGLDERWAGPPTGEELDALARAWPGGSVRALRRLVEGVLAVRERLEPCH